MMENNLKDFKAAQNLVKRLNGYEHTEIVDLTQESRGEGVQSFTLDALKEKNGEVVGTYHDSQGNTKIAVTEKNTHTMIIGMTGTGKTTGCFASSILKLSVSEDNAIIVDSKGELYANYSPLLRKNGYDVKVINLTDATCSESYNFFDEAFYYAKKKKNSNLIPYQVGEHTFYFYNGKKFFSENTAKKEKERCEKEYYNKFRQKMLDLIWLLFKDVAPDPFWGNSCRDLIWAIFHAMYEDYLAGLLNEEQFNIASMIEIFNSFGWKPRGDAIDDKGFFTSRSPDSIAYQIVKNNIFQQYSPTLKNIIGITQSNINKYDNDFSIFSKVSTISPKDFVGEKKIALFIIRNEDSKVQDQYVSLLLDEFIAGLKRIADSYSNRTLKHTVRILIDEFASLPPIQNIGSIATLRSRNIFLTLVLQSYGQLAQIYKDNYQIILDNIGTTLFLNSSNYETLKKFAIELGENTVLSPECVLNEAVPLSIVSKQAVSISQLRTLKQGEAYVKYVGVNDVFFTRFLKSYEEPEFRVVPENVRKYKSKIDIYDDKYIYRFKKKDDDEF